MSTDQLEEVQQKEVGLTVTTAADDDGVSKDIAGNNTPKSEVPIAVTVSTPSTVLTELAHQNAQVNGNDYFTSHPAEVEQQQQQQEQQFHHLRRETSNSEPAARGIFAAPAPPSTSSGTSEVTATGQVQSPVVPEQLVLPSDRPAVHSNPSSWSVQSAESVATLKAASFAAAASSAAAPAAPPAFPQSPRPAFPNQSYAALHNQQYPQPYVPPNQRQRSAGPGQIHTFTSAFASIHQQSGSRTTANTPAATPSGGLFSVQHGVPAAAEWESGVSSAGTYASPFLHFTHRVPPKETHVADVDVDPVSGRKLINHYEVIDELGRGTHGKVKLGRNLLTQDTYVAIKIVERFSKRRRLGKLSTTEDKVKKEVAILKKARHPNIVALLEVIDDPSRKKVYIVLEWVELGEIMWRAKAPKEIAKLEARRYEREKSGVNDERSIAEDIAVLSEVRKRLDKQRRRQLRTIRQMLRQAAVNGPEAWSNEMMGDDESDVSEDDLLSRISTATGDSWGSRLALDEMRRGSRASLVTRAADDSAQMQDQDSFLAVTAEPRTASPTQMRNEPADFGGGGNDGPDGLEGTMYGAYAANGSHEPSRVPSAVASLRSSISSHLLQTPAAVDNLRQIANDILDGELNDELEYVPVMTQQQCRVAFRDTMLGLQYLHYQGIVHRDIKPPNLLATKDHRVKISDFGVSYLGRPIRDDEPREDVSENDARDLDDEAKELAKTVGTPAFYAPELCIQDPSEEALPVTKAIDVWALGITLFCMLFARTPFVDNEWVMMRQIADEEIYIPTQRLVPVEPKPKARTAAHLKQQPGNVSAGRRDEFDIVYEEISEDLRHLLHGLLTKDPRKRMTLEEACRHPWTQADIVDKAAWLEEMDQFRQSEGKKIEISREDMNAAVVPLLDRVRSGIKKVSERLGFGGGKATGGRVRAHSNASQPATAGSPAPSAASSSSNISQDGRHQGYRGDESIISALKASREDQPKESPLSKSVAASPDVGRFSNPFDLDKDTPSRPQPPERANTIMATGGSMRTVRQSDYRRGRQDESPPPSPGLPGTPTMIDNPSTFGSILSGGMARRILASVRERSAARGASDNRGTSSERASVAGSVDTHGEPSLAMSQAVATGQVNQPAAFHNSPPTSNPAGTYNNPGASRPHSLVGWPSGDHLDPGTHDTPDTLSRTSSGGSITSVGKRRPANSNSARVASQSPTVSSSRPQSRMIPESSEEDWQRAEREYIRKRIAEDREARPSSAFDDRRCPPSPDDSRNNSREPRRMSQLDISAAASALASASAYSQETSPVGAGYLASAAVMSSSSDFGSTVSASISNPSIPSAASEPSSMDMAHNFSEPPLSDFRAAEYSLHHHQHHHHNDPIDEAKRNASSDDTLEPRAMAPAERASVEAVESSASNYPADYHSDADDDALIGFDSESDSDCSTDSDGGIVMSRRRSAPRRSSAAKHAAAAAAAAAATPGAAAPADKAAAASASTAGTANATDTATTPEAASERLPRRVSPPSPRSSKGASSRSGSNNTMQKVRTRESQQEENADDDDEDDEDGLVMKRSS